MANHNRGIKNGKWKGGRSIASNGYVLIRVGVEHPLADVRGYAYEHRLVATQKIGRPLLPGEIIHHINGDKQDNRPDNIEVMPSIKHHMAHHRKRADLRDPDAPNPLVLCACGCGTQFPRYDTENRPRRFVSGHNITDKHRAGRLLDGQEWNQFPEVSVHV
jgi:hypothetical protein